MGTSTATKASVTVNTFRDIYLLETLSVSATIAYSLRVLKPNYVGNLIRVRRSSDNAEQDIGFVGKDLDIASLLSFVGASSAYIVTWYNQNGAANAAQANPLSQPRIVNAGALELVSGRPAVNFMGTAHMTYTTSIAQPLTTSIVAKQTTKASARHFIDGVNNPSPRVLVTGDTNWRYYAGGTIFAGSVPSDLTPHIITNLFSGGSSSMLVDGVQVLSGSAGTNGMGAQLLGSGNGGDRLDGLIAEHIVFASMLSATQRQLLERNQSGYYNIAIS